MFIEQRHVNDFGIRAGLQLRGKKGAVPLKQKFCPQTVQHAHPNFLSPCGSFKMVAFVLGNRQRTRRKEDHIGPRTFFFKINRELEKK